MKMSNLEKLARIAAKETTIYTDQVDRVAAMIGDRMDDPQTRSEVIRAAANYAVMNGRHSARVKIKYAATQSHRGGDVILRSAHVVAQTIFDTWVVRDKLLGDATRDDLMAAASDERLQSEGHMKNAAFYDQLARKLKGNHRVRDAIKPDTASKLWAKIASLKMQAA